MILKIKKLRNDAIMPEYKTIQSAGMDLCSIEDTIIKPMEIKPISTGLAFEIEKDFEAQIRPRSGLSLKGITVANSPGTIDADYRGEIKIILINLGKEDYKISKGDRIAQTIIAKTEKAIIVDADKLSETERGSKGFGSTGLR
jgi:dUTP pyrophosphatase